MYRVGDRVVYGDNGVCEVTRIGVPDFAPQDKGQYYFLKPLFDDGMIYTPTTTATPIRLAVSRQEAEQLICDMPTAPSAIFHSRDRKLLVAHYQECLRPHTCESLAVTVRAIYEKYMMPDGTLGKLPQTEEALLRRTEKRLYEELSLALDMPPEEVPLYIDKRLSDMQAEAGASVAAEPREPEADL